MNLFVLQVMGLIQVIVCAASSKLECQYQSEQATSNAQNLPVNESSGDVQKDPEPDCQEDKILGAELCCFDGKKSTDLYNIFLQLPHSDLHNLCSLLGHEGYFSCSVPI